MELKEIDVDKVKPNPMQPREHFDREKLKELSDSIKELGLINPITVRKKGNQYEIVAGERRWKAHQIAKKKKILAIDKEYKNEGQVAIESLVENVQRTDLEPEEIGKFLKLIKDFYNCKTDTELSNIVKIDKRRIGEFVRLTDTPKELRKAIKEKKLPYSAVAEKILQLPKEKQKEIGKIALSGEGIGKEDVKSIVQEIKREELYGDSEQPTEYERTARDVNSELNDWFSNGTYLINELVKDMNINDLEKEDKDQLVTSIGVLIFNTLPKLTNVLVKAGAKVDVKILELMKKTKKK